MAQSCARCGIDLSRVARCTSMFNTDAICLDCRQDEKNAPGYVVAQDAKRRMELAGKRDFAGVGLGEADRAYLAAQRAQRKQLAGAAEGS